MVQILSMLPFDVPPPVYVLGIRVDRLTQHQALAVFEHLISQARSEAEPHHCQQVITVNPEFVMTAQHNSLFRQCINQAALVMPDGIGIVWAARYLRRPTPERVTGVDTIVELAKLCASHGYRMYLLGAAPGVAESAGERLQVLAPGVSIAGSYAGSPAVAEEHEIIERIRTSNADVLCVAYGTPAQDLWI